LASARCWSTPGLLWRMTSSPWTRRYILDCSMATTATPGITAHPTARSRRPHEPARTSCARCDTPSRQLHTASHRHASRVLSSLFSHPALCLSISRPFSHPLAPPQELSRSNSLYSAPHPDVLPRQPNPRINLRNFVYQFWLHMLLPLSIPLLISYHLLRARSPPWQAYRNQVSGQSQIPNVSPRG
jgi:hypothetical protein